MRDFIQLFVNGKPHQVTGAQALWTLSDFLRIQLGLVGTKIVCNEGDCGACSVLVAGAAKQTTNYSIAPLIHASCSCINWIRPMWFQSKDLANPKNYRPCKKPW